METRYWPNIRSPPVIPAMRPVLLVSLFDWLGSKSPPSRASTHTGPVPSSMANCAATFCLSISLLFSESPSFHVAVHLIS